MYITDPSLNLKNKINNCVSYCSATLSLVFDFYDKNRDSVKKKSNNCNNLSLGVQQEMHNPLSFL